MKVKRKQRLYLIIGVLFYVVLFALYAVWIYGMEVSSNLYNVKNDLLVSTRSAFYLMPHSIERKILHPGEDDVHAIEHSESHYETFLKEMGFKGVYYAVYDNGNIRFYEGTNEVQLKISNETVRAFEEGTPTFVEFRCAGTPVFAVIAPLIHEGKFDVAAIGTVEINSIHQNASFQIFRSAVVPLLLFLLTAPVFFFLYSISHRANMAEVERAKERYRSLVENLKSGYVFYSRNENGCMEYISPSIEEILGYKPEYFKAYYEKVLLSFSGNRKVLRVSYRMGKKHIPYSFDLEVYTQKGEKRYFRVSEYPFTSEKKTYIDGLAYDVTEDYLLNQKLTESEKFFSDVFESIRAGISVVDKSFKIIRHNSYLTTLFNKSNCLGETCHSLLREDSGVCNDCPVARVFAGALFADAQIVYMKNGNKKYYGIYAYPLKDESGNIFAAVEYVQDITEQVEREKGIRAFMFLADATTDVMALFDKTYTLVAANKAFLEAYNLKTKDISITSAREAWGNEDFGVNIEPYFKKAWDGKLETVESEVFMHERGQRYIRRKFYPFRSTGGEISHVAFVGHDITDLNRAKEALSADLAEKKASIAKAQSLQKKLNSKELPVVSSLISNALYMPSEELGGDFFNVIEIDRKIIILMGDCTGHGIEASMDATLLKSICDRHTNILAQTMATHKFLDFVNTEIMAYSYEDKFPSLFVGIYDIDQRVLAYSAAGSHMPYLIRDNSVLVLERPKGFLLGFDPETYYQIRFETLREGDVLFFYSDALIEIMLDKDVIFNSDSLRDFVKHFGEGAKADINGLLKHIRGLRDLPLEDDLTLMHFEVPIRISGNYSVRDTVELDGLRVEIEGFLARLDFSQKDIDGVSLALIELGTNAIEHGNKYSSDKEVFISFVARADYVEISIEDEGDGFAFEDVDYPIMGDALDEAVRSSYSREFTRGRGIWISKEYVDNVFYDNKGSKVTFNKRRSPSKTIFL